MSDMSIDEFCERHYACTKDAKWMRDNCANMIGRRSGCRGRRPGVRLGFCQDSLG
jgi:hypothetical protein